MFELCSKPITCSCLGLVLLERLVQSWSGQASRCSEHFQPCLGLWRSLTFRRPSASSSYSWMHFNAIPLSSEIAANSGWMMQEACFSIDSYIPLTISHQPLSQHLLGKFFQQMKFENSRTSIVYCIVETSSPPVGWWSYHLHLWLPFACLLPQLIISIPQRHYDMGCELVAPCCSSQNQCLYSEVVPLHFFLNQYVPQPWKRVSCTLLAALAAQNQSIISDLPQF